MKANLEEKFKRVSKQLVGVWRFKERTEDKKWAATYFFKGKYHDIYPVDTIEKALDIVYRNVIKMRNRVAQQK